MLFALVFSQTAMALATIEFLKMEGSQQYDVVKPIMLSVLQRGYKKVPSNEFTLINAIKKLAFEKGYTYQNIENVAEEAAIGLGMTR